MTWLASAAAIAIAVVSGGLVWRRLHGTADGLHALAYAWPTAVVLVGLEMLVVSAVGAHYTLATLLVPLALLAVVCAVPFRSVRPPASSSPLRWGGRVALAVIVAEIALVAAEIAAGPTLDDWDGWAIWGLKATAFFVDGTVRDYLAAADRYEFSWPARPCLSSLFQAFVYAARGGVDEAAARLAHTLTWVSLLLVFHVSARRRLGTDRALVWTALLATVPNLTYVAIAGVGNVLLGLFLLATLSSLDGWHTASRPARLAGSALMLAGAFLSRDEGRLFGCAVVAAAFFLGPWPGGRPSLRRRVAACAAVGLAAFAGYGLWSFLLASAPTPVSGGSFSLEPGMLSRLVAHLPDVPAILAASARELAQPSEQHRASGLEGVLGVCLLWPLFALASVTGVRLRRTDAVGFRCLVVTWFGLLSYTTAFALFPYVDLPDLFGGWLFVFDRHAMALAPLAVRVIASAFPAPAGTGWCSSRRAAGGRATGPAVP